MTQTLNGLFSAALLFLIASGLTLVFGVMRIVNIAHGSFYMLGRVRRLDDRRADPEPACSARSSAIVVVGGRRLRRAVAASCAASRRGRSPDDADDGVRAGVP